MRHYGGVQYSDSLNAMDFGVLVYHGQGVGGGAHFAGAGGVMAGPDILPEPEIKGIVGVKDFV